MYVWDTQHKLHYRTNVVPNSNISPVVLQALKAMLDETNPYVTNFRYISDLPAENIGNISMLIHADISGLDQRTHNAPPTVSQVAAIWIKAFARNGMVQGEYGIYTRNIVYKEAL